MLNRTLGASHGHIFIPFQTVPLSCTGHSSGFLRRRTWWKILQTLKGCAMVNVRLRQGTESQMLSDLNAYYVDLYYYIPMVLYIFKCKIAIGEHFHFIGWSTTVSVWNSLEEALNRLEEDCVLC